MGRKPPRNAGRLPQAHRRAQGLRRGRLRAAGENRPRSHRHHRPGNVGDVQLENTCRPEKGPSLVRYQARLGRTQTTAKFDLELVPVEANSNTFTLRLRGAPLAGEGVTLFTSSGWNRTFKSGADGRVTIETPWAGPAVLEVGYDEPKAGEHEGRAHESIRHVFTLSFTVAAK